VKGSFVRRISTDYKIGSRWKKGAHSTVAGREGEPHQLEEEIKGKDRLLGRVENDNT